VATRKGGDLMVAKKTVLQVFVEKSGQTKAIRAIEWLAEWGAVYERLGRAPKVEEFAKLAGRDRTTMWRYSGAFRASSMAVSAERIWLSLPKKVRAGVGRTTEERFADVASSAWTLGDG
jgi:hypothetical protein